MEHHHHEGGEAHHVTHHKPEQVTLRLSKRTIYIIVAVILVAVLGYFGKGFFVVASVDGRLISRLAVVRELEAVSGKQALDSLVIQKLISAEAKKNGVSVTDEEVKAEVAKIALQMQTQGGGTLEAALAAQGMTLETLEKQLRTQKLLEKLVVGTQEVTPEEIAQFIKANNVVVPEGQEAQYDELAKNQLVQQKLNAAKTTYVNDLKAKAKIRIFTTY
ncbi:MAG: SurA N-terminal domain-containing protein [bacterium]|nr:SurA N-terminal domain-containing protein [bacterium]